MGSLWGCNGVTMGLYGVTMVSLWGSMVRYGVLWGHCVSIGLYGVTMGCYGVTIGLYGAL